MAATETALIESLNKVLANTYLLAIKTQGYHWNVTGPQFPGLHTLFEEHYTELLAASDEIAERVRALGSFPPGTSQEFRQIAEVPEPAEVRDASQMLKNLTADHELLSRLARETAEIADELDDDGSEDMMIARIQVHDKAAWMLRSSI